jgi:hypothetical protein
MKVISYQEGLAAWVLPLSVIAPDTGAPLFSIINDLGEFFQFQTPGINPQNFPAFQGGTWSLGGTAIAINQLEITDQMVTAICTKTEYADAFLQAVLARLQERHGFKKVGDFKRNYRSMIVSEMPFDVSEALERWQGLANFASEMLRDRSGATIAIEPGGMKFLPAVRSGGDAFFQFLLERRIGPGAGPNRIFSAAPLTTEEHLKFLERYEETFSS